MGVSVRPAQMGGAKPVIVANEIGRTKSDATSQTAQTTGAGAIQGSSTFVHRLYYKFASPLRVITGILADAPATNISLSWSTITDEPAIIAQAVTSALDLSTLTWANQSSLTVANSFNSRGREVMGYSNPGSLSVPATFDWNIAHRWSINKGVSTWPFVDDGSTLLYGIVMQFSNETIGAGDSFSFPHFPTLYAIPA